jgi:hypothetical protein
MGMKRLSVFVFTMLLGASLAFAQGTTGGTTTGTDKPASADTSKKGKKSGKKGHKGGKKGKKGQGESTTPAPK